ncbi:MAG TPA: hypothetical protein PLE19_07940 [Planctomycetota bacterium]|nr:hypothetical protein [Planctomycetota bacterium]HRR78886.1 hypothetical protein [Planctomycetota bacterium]HRT93911.1 hypothetical protein [Planctomycetota bacterium]
MAPEGEKSKGLASIAAGMAQGATVRAIAVGALLCAVIGVSTPYATNVMHASYMDLDFSTPAAIFLFFVLIFFVNGALRAISARLALTAGELVVVYVMMMIGTVIPTMGLTAYWLSTIAAPFYYAAPENQWAEIILPHIPKWLYPDDPMAIRWLYEGLPRGEALPWGAWLLPLGQWLVFLLVLYGVMICAMVILRKQWVEHERLLYPITQLPMEMVRAEPRPGFSNPFIRNPWMWAGLIIPFLLGCYIALTHYDPSFPAIEMVTKLDLFRKTTVLKLRLSFPMIGFSYLLSTSLALSLWFFGLVTIFERAALRLVGYEGVEQLDPYSQSGGGPLLTHQSQAALFVLVLYGLWMARRHLKAVFLKAIGRAKDVDDSEEILSYRQAFWGLMAGMAYMAFWLHRSGMSLWVAVALVLVSMATFLGVTRIVAAGGVAETRSPMTASTVLISAFGSERLGPSNLVPFGMTYIWMGDIRTFIMASAANGLKMVSDVKGRKRPIFWAMIIAILVTIAASVWSTMLVAFQHGGANANDWLWRAGPTLPFDYVTRLIRTPEGPSVNGALFGGIGAAAMAVLMILNHRFVSWPLHPLGFPIASLWLTEELWFSIFIAWAAKALVLRYGGADLYKRTRLFFLGLILGQYAVSGVWIVIDYFTGKVGNSLFWI